LHRAPVDAALAIRRQDNSANNSDLSIFLTGKFQRPIVDLLAGSRV
jgi:hypothetical protein